MSETDAIDPATPLLAPRPLCAAYAPSLRLLRSGGLEPSERVALDAHLAACAWCQNQLATYDIVDAALRRHFASDRLVWANGDRSGDRRAAAPTGERGRLPATLDATLHPGDVEDEDTGDAEWTSPSSASCAGPSPRSQASADPYRSLTPLARITFVIVLAVLAAALFARLGGTRGVPQSSSLQPASGAARSPTVAPTRPATQPLDPQAQAYVDLLRTYYQPLYADLASSRTCEDAYAASEHAQEAPDDQLNALLACRDAEAAVLAAAQTLSHHLEAAAPPVRWQAAHHDLVQAALATMLAYHQRVAAIDAHSLAQFTQAAAQSYSDLLMPYCDPIALINAELPTGSTLDFPSATCSAPPIPHQPHAAGDIQLGKPA